MGGVVIDDSGRVQRKHGSTDEAIQGLYAAGEVVGGIHGKNRLGGNALTEALVFGRVAAKSVIKEYQTSFKKSYPTKEVLSSNPIDESKESDSNFRVVSRDELTAHEEDCWVQIGDLVYDLHDFVEDHPAGPEAITELAGTNGTPAFLAAHTFQMLDDFDDCIVGKMEGS